MFWCQFLEPYLTTYHYNIGVKLVVVIVKIDRFALHGNMNLS